MPNAQLAIITQTSSVQLATPLRIISCKGTLRLFFGPNAIIARTGPLEMPQECAIPARIRCVVCWGSISLRATGFATVVRLIARVV